MDVDISEFILEDFGLNQKSKFGRKFSKENLELLRELRVLVRFGGRESFEARPWEMQLENGSLEFIHFYPQETGPLPAEGHSVTQLNEGFFLYLPNDFEKLKQIRVMFVLAPKEQPQDAPTRQNNLK